MVALRALLFISTAGIYLFTVAAVTANGVNWPAVAFSDLLALNWRSQFDFDLIIHLLLLATWISWREGFTAKGHVFGLLSVAMGGMFSFPYLLYATYAAKGRPADILLGIHKRGSKVDADCA
ncbi:MAG: hypothetical protein ACR2PZ_27315 [Pseudomonadales bacterium]